MRRQQQHKPGSQDGDANQIGQGSQIGLSGLSGLKKWRRLWSTLFAGLVLAATTSSIGAQVAGAEEVDDLDTSAVYHYRVNAEEGRIEVEAEVKVTAAKPSRSTSRGTTSFYFTGYYLTLPSEANDVSVQQNGSDLEFEVFEEGEGFQVLDIPFRRNIFYRQTATLVVTYWVDGAELRDESFVRVNEAFVTFDIWSDSGIESSKYYVHMPEALDHQRDYGSEFSSLNLDSEEGRSVGEVAEGTKVLKASHDLDDGDWFWEQVVLTNDAALVRTEVDAGGHSVVIESWPNDAEWATFVSETVEQGLPALIELIGVPWPVEGDLTITESNIPYYSGYAGWYSTDTNIIELGDELDGQILLHEVSHAWFNEDLFAERWITEGLADVYAAEAGRLIGLDDADGPKASLVDSEAKALSMWRTSFTNSSELEQWSYGASWTVADEIASEVGFDSLRAVLVARSEGGLAYVGEGDSEVVDSIYVKDWEAYIDLLEEVGGADDLQDLFTDWVASGPMGKQLRERAETREVYEAFVERGADWAAPLGVRAAMADWKFEDAEEAMTAALEVLEIRDETDELLSESGYVLTDDVEEAYEVVEADFDDVRALASETYETAGIVIAAAEVVDSDPAFFTKVGLIGTDPDVALDAAIAALADGDLELAVAESGEAESLVVEAEAIGKKRTGIAAGSGVVVLGLVFFVLRRRRRRKSNAGTNSQHGELSDSELLDGELLDGELLDGELLDSDLQAGSGSDGSGSDGSNPSGDTPGGGDSGGGPGGSGPDGDGSGDSGPAGAGPAGAECPNEEEIAEELLTDDGHIEPPHDARRERHEVLVPAEAELAEEKVSVER